MKKLCECGCGLEVSPGKRFRQGHNMRVKEIRQKQIEKHKETRKINKEIKEGKQPAPVLPFCACGCGGRVTKLGNKYINGHYVRVNNPSKGKTKENDERVRKAGEKSSKTKKEFFASEEGQKWIDDNIRGENSPSFGKKAWNFGLTKETDERVKKIGETYKERYTKGEIDEVWSKGKTKETEPRLMQLSKSLLDFYQSDEGIELKIRLSENKMEEKNHMYGKHISDEAKQKSRKSHLGKKHTEATKQLMRDSSPHISGKDHPMYGKHHTKKARQKLSDATSGENNPFYGRHHTDEAKQLVREAFFLNLKNGVYNKKPNLLEKDIDDIVQLLFHNEYKYNGNYELGISIGGKIPDFVNINGKKKAIDAFGDYWHEGEDPQVRIDLFKKYGWDLLVIWQHELKDKDAVIQKILKFHGVESDYVIPQETLDKWTDSKDNSKRRR